MNKKFTFEQLPIDFDGSPTNKTQYIIHESIYLLVGKRKSRLGIIKLLKVENLFTYHVNNFTLYIVPRVNPLTRRYERMQIQME